MVPLAVGLQDTVTGKSRKGRRRRTTRDLLAKRAPVDISRGIPYEAGVSVTRILPLPADPIALARKLADRPGLALLASRPQGAPRPEDARWSFVACEPVEASDDLVPPGGDDDEGGASPAPRWIGVVPYDALRGLERPRWTRHPDDRAACAFVRPAWRRYAAVVRVDHATGEVAVIGDDDRCVTSLAHALGSGARRGAVYRFELCMLPPDEPDEAHVERVREALRLIAAGDLYEVNLARRIPLSIRGHGLELFASLLDAAPAPWGFLQVLRDNGSERNVGAASEHVVCGVSPELALSVRGATLRTCPIKGTRPRGRDAAQDARLAQALDADPKERAELTMAVDVHRNDLGRVAQPGSVRVHGDPRLLAGATVWSRVAEVVARRAPGVSLRDVAAAALPCGSITGAPKVRAMEVIAQLEPWRRGAYTGAFGWVGRDGRLELAMAIRTLQWSRDRRARSDSPAEGEYFAGGGIVADSVPERELEETRWKATQLSLVRLSAAGAN
jgi:anthranilate/para-aminobenzoate synthase component I